MLVDDDARITCLQKDKALEKRLNTLTEEQKSCEHLIDRPSACGGKKRGNPRKAASPEALKDGPTLNPENQLSLECQSKRTSLHPPFLSLVNKSFSFPPPFPCKKVARAPPQPCSDRQESCTFIIRANFLKIYT